MALLESGEMYLETIHVLSKQNGAVRSIDISEHMGYSKPSVSRAVGLLKKGGYIVVDKDGFITLTEVGESVANKIYERHTVLSRMLYSGAIAMGRLLSVDGATEAASLGYSPEQFEWLLEHEAELWRTLVAKQLVYDTDPQTADRLVSPAPATPLLSIYSPGRVGRFIGYRMVRSYLARHPEKRLSDLLSPDFYNSPDALSLVDYSPD